MFRVMRKPEQRYRSAQYSSALASIKDLMV